MRIDSSTTFQVVEFDSGIAIIDGKDALRRPGARALIITDNPEALAEYLLRFLHARRLGKDTSVAHEQALQGAITVGGGGEIVPGTTP
jgi:hypothetical protein